MAKDKNEVATPEADEWQAKDDLQTLARAAQIRSDPKRMRAAMEQAKKKVAEMEELQKAIAQHNKTAAKAV